MTSQNGHLNEEEPLAREVTVYDSLYSLLRSLSDRLKSSSNVLKQSLAAILFSIVTAIIAGVILQGSEETLRMLPGLIILIPAAIGMRGNIFSSMGSRLGSALHLGNIKKFGLKNRTIRNNISAAITLTIIFSFLSAFIARSILYVTGFPSISILYLVLISFLAGMISVGFMLVFTFIISLKSYERGWDPDNLTSPMISALGDLFTIPSLLISAYFVMHLGSNTQLLDIAVFSIFLLSLLPIVIRNRKSMRNDYKKIVIQSAPIIAISLMIDSLAGLFINITFESITGIAFLLMVLPAFLEEGGNIGTVLASRLSTKLHLGTMKPDLTLSGEIKKEFFNSYFLAVAIFPILSIASYATASFLAIPVMPFLKVLTVVFFAGITMTTFIIILSFIISVLSYKYRFDPDNVTIPIITSTADLVGAFSLLVTAKMFGLI